MSVSQSYPSRPLLWMASSSVIPSSDLKASQSNLDFSSVLILAFLPPMLPRMLPIPAGRFELPQEFGHVVICRAKADKCNNLDASTKFLLSESKTEIISLFLHWENYKASEWASEWVSARVPGPRQRWLAWLFVIKPVCCVALAFQVTLGFSGVCWYLFVDPVKTQHTIIKLSR